jgi:hypothetical protein
VIVQPLRYGLATPQFRFRALATFAGNASLGGDREVALACFVGGRLASAMLAPYAVQPSNSKVRSAAAKQWLSSLSLPAPIRAAAVHLADTVASGDRAATAASLMKLLDVASRNIDEASASELRAVVAELAPVA